MASVRPQTYDNQHNAAHADTPSTDAHIGVVNLPNQRYVSTFSKQTLKYFKTIQPLNLCNQN